MDLMTRLLRELMPRVGATLGIIRDAIAGALETVRGALYALRTEANPGTAVDTLAHWYQTLGLNYDSRLPLETRQALASQAFANIGGQSLATLNEAIRIAFPDVFLVRPTFSTELMVGVAMTGQVRVTDYPDWYTGVEDGSYPVSYYLVDGEVNSANERTALLNLLDRIAPAWMEPVIGSLVIRDQTATGEAGLTMVGLGQVGRTKEDI